MRFLGLSHFWVTKGPYKQGPLRMTAQKESLFFQPARNFISIKQRILFKLHLCVKGFKMGSVNDLYYLSPAHSFLLLSNFYTQPYTHESAEFGWQNIADRA